MTINALFCFVFIGGIINFSPDFGRFKHIYYRMKKMIVFLVFLSLLLLSACSSDALNSNNLVSTTNGFAGINVTGISNESISDITAIVKDVRQGKIELSENEMEKVKFLINKYGLFDLVEVAFPDEELECLTLKSGMTVQKKDDFYIIGDILFTEEQIKEFYTKTESDNYSDDIQLRGSISTVSSHKWPGGTVYYEFDANMTQATKIMALEAMSHWASVTNINYMYKTSSNKDYIRFFNGVGCYSYIGRQGGKQDLSLDASWAVTGNAIHEFGHAIGLHHEHCKLNRDQDIIVSTNNIQQASLSNYTRVTSNSFFSFNFDYGSIMLYSSFNSTAINQNLPVMTTLSGSTWTAQRNSASAADIAVVNFIY